MGAAAEPGLQPEVGVPELQLLAEVDLQAQESGKPETRERFQSILIYSAVKKGTK